MSYVAFLTSFRAVKCVSGIIEITSNSKRRGRGLLQTPQEVAGKLEPALPKSQKVDSHKKQPYKMSRTLSAHIAPHADTRRERVKLPNTARASQVHRLIERRSLVGAFGACSLGGLRTL